MAISTATFRTNEVTLFLSREFPYAATCFSQDMLKHGETVSSILVEKWFKSYFPSNVNQFQYRLLQASVTQTIQFEKVNN
jgi:hypothetical protein